MLIAVRMSPISTIRLPNDAFVPFNKYWISIVYDDDETSPMSFDVMRSLSDNSTLWIVISKTSCGSDPVCLYNPNIGFLAGFLSVT